MGHHALFILTIACLTSFSFPMKVRCMVGTVYNKNVEYFPTKVALYCRIMTLVDGENYFMRGDRVPLPDAAMEVLKKRKIDVFTTIFCYLDKYDGREIINCYCKFNYCNQYRTMNELWNLVNQGVLTTTLTTSTNQTDPINQTKAIN